MYTSKVSRSWKSKKGWETLLERRRRLGAKCDSGLHHFLIKDTVGMITETQTGSHD